MNKTTKTVLWLVVIALIIWGGVKFFGGKKVTTNEPINIGVVAPMTGGATTYGIGLTKGIQLAKEDLKNTKNIYEFIVEDDAGNMAQSASAAQKLINIDKVQGIITVTSGTGNAVKPIAANAHIPHICVCSDIRIADGQYNFTNLVLPDDEATAWLKKAKQNGVKTVAILAQNQAGFNLLTDNVKKKASGYGIRVIYDESFDPTAKDFNTGIAKARAAKPDIYLIGFLPPQLDIIGQELKNLGVTNVTGMATFPTSATPELFNDRWYTDASLADPAFKDKFTREFPDTRFNVRVVPYGYDSFNLLVNALESGNSINYLLNITSYQGKAGDIVKSKGNTIFRSPVGIWQIKQGQAVQLQ